MVVLTAGVVPVPLLIKNNGFEPAFTLLIVIGVVVDGINAILVALPE